MLPFERQEQILSYLQKAGCVPVKELTANIFVSEATARRDIAYLETKDWCAGSTAA